MLVSTKKGTKSRGFKMFKLKGKCTGYPKGGGKRGNAWFNPSEKGDQLIQYSRSGAVVDGPLPRPKVWGGTKAAHSFTTVGLWHRG